MKNKLLWIFLCIIVLTGCGRNNSDDENSLHYNEITDIYAMDTVMELKAYGKNSQKALKEAQSIIEKYDGLLNRHSENSEIYKINNNIDSRASADVLRLIERAVDISKITDGAFDITIAPVMDLWGFFTGEYKVAQKYEIFSELKKVGYKNISINGNNVDLSGGATIDAGGIAKGFLSAEIAGVFKENEIELWQNYSGESDFEAVFITENNEIFITYGLIDLFESDYEYSVINR